MDEAGAEERGRGWEDGRAVQGVGLIGCGGPGEVDITNAGQVSPVGSGQMMFY